MSKDPNELMTGPGLFALIVFAFALMFLSDWQPAQIWDWYWNNQAQIPMPHDDTVLEVLVFVWNNLIESGLVRELLPLVLVGCIVYQLGYELLCEVFKDREPPLIEEQLLQSFRQALAAGQLQDELQQKLSELSGAVNELSLAQAVEKASNVELPEWMKDIAKDPQSMLVYLCPELEKKVTQLLELHGVSVVRKRFVEKISLLKTHGLVSDTVYGNNEVAPDLQCQQPWAAGAIGGV